MSDRTFTERQKPSPGPNIRFNRLPPDSWALQLAQVPDAPFIIDSWCADEALHVGRQSNESPEVGKAGMRGRINRLISACPCVVIRLTPAYFQAHSTADPRKNLAGWACYSFDKATYTPVLHFVYVKAEFRGQGLASALLGAAGVKPGRSAWCTHDRLRLGKVMKSRNILYNKYLLDYDHTAPGQTNTRIMFA